MKIVKTIEAVCIRQRFVVINYSMGELDYWMVKRSNLKPISQTIWSLIWIEPVELKSIFFFFYLYFSNFFIYFIKRAIFHVETLMYLHQWKRTFFFQFFYAIDLIFTFFLSTIQKSWKCKKICLKNIFLLNMFYVLYIFPIFWALCTTYYKEFACKQTNCLTIAYT